MTELIRHPALPKIPNFLEGEQRKWAKDLLDFVKRQAEATYDQQYHDDLVVKGPWIDVRAHGAVGDGSTDDSTAFQSAIDALPAAGGEIFVKPLRYYFASGISTGTKKSVVFRCIGGFAHPLTSYTAGALFETDQAITILTAGSASETTAHGIELHNIGFRGTSGTAANGLEVLRQNFVRLVNVTAGEFDQGIGIEFDGTGDSCTLCEVHGGFIRNCLNGYKLTSTAAFRFVGGYVGGADLASSIGINVVSGDTTEFFGTAVDTCAKGIVIATGGGWESDFCNGYGVRLENNNVGIEINTDYNRFFGTTIIGTSGDVGFDVNAGAIGNKLRESVFSGLDAADRVQDAGTRTTRIDRFQHYVQDEAVHTIGHKVVSGAAISDLVLANSKKLKSVDGAGTGTDPLIMQDASDIVNLYCNRARSADGDTLLYLYAPDQAGTQSIVLKIRASGTGVGVQTIRLDFTDHETDTSATAGSNGDVPAQVDGYLTIEVAGTKKKIPYYAD